MNNITNNIRHNALIFLQLLRRDVKILKSNLFSSFIDNCSMLLTFIFLFGYLLPKMGMEKNLIGPVFLGQTLSQFFQIGFGLATRIVQDIKFNKFIDYHIGLPISIYWLIAEYITHFIIEAAVIILPILVLGILLLGKNFIIYKTNWFAFTLIYLLISIFFATLFLFFSFAYDFDWFWKNIWTRRIEPIFLFGCVLFVWKKLDNFSPILAKIFLLNPATYASEGIRGALIGGDQFLPITMCVVGLIIGISINIALLFPSIKKALDHV